MVITGLIKFEIISRFELERSLHFMNILWGWNKQSVGSKHMSAAKRATSRHRL